MDTHKEITPYEKRLKEVIDKLKEYDDQVITKRHVFKILFEKLAKYGIQSHGGLREYYHILRDLGVVQEIGLKPIRNQFDKREYLMHVKINIKPLEEIGFLQLFEEGVKKCPYCAKEFKDDVDFIIHRDNCEKRPKTWES